MTTVLEPEVVEVVEVTALPPDDELSLILFKAADKLDAGWIQFGEHCRWPDGNDTYCAIGAINVAVRPDYYEKHRPSLTERDQTLIWKARDAIRLTTRKDVISFNDTQGRTKNEVVLAFIRASKWHWASKRHCASERIK